MNKLLIALIAGTFAATAAAQMPAPSEKAKAKQEIVKEATKVPEQSSPTANAAQQKMNTEASKKVGKALPDKMAKREAVKAAEKVGQEGSTGAMTAADAAKNTAASKGMAKALPTAKDKRKAAAEVTKEKASQ